MIGEVPKDVNEATAQKILEMMSELRENGLISKGMNLSLRYYVEICSMGFI